MRKLPLAGYRVLEFSWVFAGPTCCLILASLGAEVIKIESHKRPDTSRRLRMFAGGVAQPLSGGGFDNLNFNKKAITLDLVQPEAGELARRLVRTADVVVENYSYGVMEKFGLGYETLRQITPDLVMLSFSLFGRDGPLRHYFGFGGPLPVYTGLASITGYPHEGTPRTVAASWVDPLNGVSAAFAILAALHHRNRTGEGQYIDLSMSEGGIAVLPEGFLDYVMNGHVPGLQGNRDEQMVPHGVYRCQGEDAWIAIAVSSKEEWQALCHVLGDPLWCQEERFADRLQRFRHQDELDRLIEAWTRERTPYEAMEALQRAGVAAGPVLNRKELLEDPHLEARGAFIAITQSNSQGTKPMPALPWKFSAMPPLRAASPPLLGEDNEALFTELLGLNQEEYQELVEKKVIF